MDTAEEPEHIVLGHIDDLVRNETVGLAVNLGESILRRCLCKAEDSTAVRVEPIREELDVVVARSIKVGDMRLGYILCRRAGYIVAIHEHWHYAPPCSTDDTAECKRARSAGKTEEEPVPGGSAYQGPSEALDQYLAVAESAGEVVKGAKNPYTSLNGHMFSFLDPEGTMAIRLSAELGDEFLSQYESGPVIQYGSVMRGYLSVPDALLDDIEECRKWFVKSRSWIGTLEPKPTKK